MSSLWKILNAPLIVVIIAFSIWPVLTVLSSGVAVKLGIKQISAAVSEEVVKPFKSMSADQDAKLKTEAGIIDKVNISQVGFAPTPWQGKAKIIGTLTNHSEQAVKSINLTASFYQDGNLINVNEEWLSKIKLLKAGESADFTFTTDLAEGQSTDNLQVKIKVSDLSILE